MNHLTSEIVCVVKHAAHCKRVRPTRAARQINFISNTTGKVTSTAISGVATPLAQDKLDKMSNKP